MILIIFPIFLGILSSVNSVPVGVASPKSSLYSFDNGILQGGYNIAKTINDASSSGKSGDGFALNADYSQSIGFKKNPKTGESNTQTAGTTGINAAIQLPVVDQTLLNKYAKKKPVI